LANQITGEKRIFVNRRPKKISLAQRGEAIVLKYTPFLKVQSYTFDADFLKNMEWVICPDLFRYSEKIHIKQKDMGSRSGKQCVPQGFQTKRNRLLVDLNFLDADCSEI